MAARIMLIAAIVVVVLLAAIYGVIHYMTGVPGRSHSGALPALTDEERALSAMLKRHLEAIATREHNIPHYDELENAARTIEATLTSYGYSVGRQEFAVAGRTVRNIEAVIEARADRANPEVIVVGAHYDSVQGSPGANDNGSGAAAVLELARLLHDLSGAAAKRIRLVLFVNEEPPYFKTEDMGSLHYARALAERRERVAAMISLETIGYYSSAPGSQRGKGQASAQARRAWERSACGRRVAITVLATSRGHKSRLKHVSEKGGGSAPSRSRFRFRLVKTERPDFSGAG